MSWDDDDEERGSWQFEPAWLPGMAPVPDMQRIQVDGANRCPRRIRAMVTSTMRGVWLRVEPG